MKKITLLACFIILLLGATTKAQVPTPVFDFTIDTLRVSSNSCSEIIQNSFTVQNNGGASLEWQFTERSQKNSIKVAVFNDDGNNITNVLNKQSDIQATSLTYYNAEILSGYDVLLSARGSNLKQEVVLEFIAQGGTWIGEYSSNSIVINDWEIITSSQKTYSAGSGSQSVSIVDTDHYLATDIDWNNIPVGANPCDYMYDLRVISDADANIIATVNHSSFGDNTLLLEKQYGEGKVILFNWDYRDDPDYNSYVEDMIQEVVRYGGIENEVPWLSLNNTSGNLNANTETDVLASFNSDGLKAGIYYGELVAASNDPINAYDTLVCEFTVEGTASIATDISSINLGSTFVNGKTEKELKIYSTSCDTLNVSNLIFSQPEFSSSTSNFDILPSDSTSIVISYSPSVISVHTGTLSIVSNVNTVQINLNGNGIAAPLMTSSTDTLRAAVTVCNDKQTLQFTIENSGGANLDFNLNNAKPGKKEILSLSYGVDMDDEYPNTLKALDKYLSDYNLTEINTEVASTLELALIDKDVLLIPKIENASASTFTNFAPVLQSFTENGGTVIFCGTGKNDCINSSGLFTSDINRSTSSGSSTVTDSKHPLLQGISLPLNFTTRVYEHVFIDADIVSLTDKDPYYKSLVYREIGLGKAIYLGYDFYNTNTDAEKLLANTVEWGSNKLTGWLNPSDYYGTIAAGESKIIELEFNATGYVAGNYTYDLIVNSNAPLNSADTIVCEFTVNGTSEISSSATLIDLGDVLLGDSALFDLKIYDFACDTLNISDIISSSPDFTLSSTNFNVLPTDSVSINVKFKPSTVKYYTETITLKTNDKDWVIDLAGIGFHQPEMLIANNTIELILTDCHASGTVPVTFENNGPGLLSYELPKSEAQLLPAGTDYDRTWGGAMFDITTNQEIAISAFEVYYNKENYNFEVEVYFRQGSYRGHTSASGWTHHGNYSQKSNAVGEPDIVSIDDLKLPAGDYAIYIRPTGNSFLYEYSTSNYSDGILTIKPGISKSNFQYWSLDDVIFKGGILYKTKEDWIVFSVHNGTINSNQSEVIDFEFNADGLFPGTYTSNVIVKSNDPTKRTDTVQCTLNILSASPEFVAESKDFNFGDVATASNLSRDFEIYNTGCDTLDVNNITSSIAEFTVSSATAFKIPPQDTATISINFAPNAVQAYTGALTIYTNDADSAINLTGNGENCAITSVVSWSSNGYYKNGSTIEFTIRFNEAVVVDTALGVPYLILNTTPVAYARFSDKSAGNECVFEYKVGNENSALLNYTSINDLVLNGGTITNSGTNAGITLPDPETFSATRTFIIDNTAPVASISVPKATTNDSVQIATITFNENVSNFGINDIVVANASLDNFTTISNFRYTVEVKAVKDSAVTIDIPENICVDEAINNNEASAQAKYTFENKKPVISIAVDGNKLTNASPFTATISFNESASELRLSEISVSNGSAANFIELVPNLQYSIEITPLSEGTVSISVIENAITDLAGNGNAASTSTIEYDLSAPTASLSTETAATTNQSEFAITVEFSEKMAGLDTTDFVSTNARVSKVTEVQAGTKYTATIIPINDGTVTVYLAANSTTDVAGNALATQSNTISVVFDGTAPVTSLTSAAPHITNTSPISVNIEFTEVISGFELADLEFINASADTLIEVTSGLKYTLDIVPTDTGEVIVNIPADIAIDAVNNGNESASITFIYDNILPIASLTSDKNSSTNADTANLSILFSELVSGFELADIVLSNATASNFTEIKAGLEYVVHISPIDTGNVTVSIPANAAIDSANNGNTASSVSYIYDTIAPLVELSCDLNSPTNSKNIAVNIAFSEEVSMFGTANIKVLNGNVNKLELVESHKAYIAYITPKTNGEIIVSIADSSLTDLAGNYNTGKQLSITYDGTAPIVTLTSSDSILTNASPINVCIEFSETVTGFELTDLVLINATASSLSELTSGLKYNVEVTPIKDSIFSISVAADSTSDAAGNGNMTANFTTTYDGSAPTVSLTSASASPSNTAPINVVIEFSETVSGFELADIILTNASCDTLVEITTGLKYTVNLAPIENGEVVLSLLDNISNDLAGNGNIANSFTMVYDTVAPFATITPEASKSSTINLNIVFSEAITGFELSDLKLKNATTDSIIELSKGLAYKIGITPSITDDALVSIPAGAVSDLAGNTNTLCSINIKADDIAPTVTLSSKTAYKSNETPIYVSIEFSEVVTGFDSSNLLCKNARVTNLLEEITGLKYSAEITPDTCGIIAIYIADSSVIDLAGNPNMASDTLSRYIDYSAPVLSDIKVLNITETSAQVQFNSSKLGIAHYIIHSSTDTAPGISDVLMADSISIMQLESSTIDCNNLEANTSYTIYIAEKDSLNNQSELYMIDFTTTIVGSELETNPKMLVYPNPTKGKLTIESTNALIEQITVMDLNGKIVYQKQNCINNIIDLSNLESQIYMVHILTNKGITVTRIMKE